MDLVAMLPWWVGIGLALAIYLLLHRVASPSVVAMTQPGQLVAMVTQTLWTTFASIGQYVLPVTCLVGSGISVWRRKARKSLVVDVIQSKASDALNGMSWREFEMLVGEGFRLEGYQVVETGGAGADGPKLHQLLRQAKAGSIHSPALPAAAPAVHPITAPVQSPTCPLCAQPMVRRTAKRGMKAGVEFWGCAGYPACRGTRPIG